MGWTASMVVGLITALLACVLAGWIASLYADWYQMSSFEGASGYFIVGMALLGFLAGLALGIVVSRFVTSAAGKGCFRALGTSDAIVAGLSLVISGTARLLADIPPKLDGDTLHLAVEGSAGPRGAFPPLQRQPANGHYTSVPQSTAPSEPV